MVALDIDGSSIKNEILQKPSSVDNGNVLGSQTSGLDQNKGIIYLNVVWKCVFVIFICFYSWQQIDLVFWFTRFGALLTHWSVQQNPKLRAGI